MKYDISVVIPIYNSEKILDELYIRLTSVLTTIACTYEVILIDDGSIDRSYLKMCELHEQDKRIRIIQLDGNYGQQNAIMCGLHHARGDYVITMDDDLQNPPEEFNNLITKLNEGYDVVYGIPLEKMHPFYRNFGTKMTDLVFTKVCGKPKNIKVSSFRVMTKALVQRIIEDKTSFVYISAIILKKTIRIENVLVKHDVRKYGKSNYNLRKLIKLFFYLVIYYSPIAFRFPHTSSHQFVVRDMHV